MASERIVADANVLISALLVRGTAWRAFQRFAERDATLLFSDATFAEVVNSLSRPKFDRYRTAEQMDAFLSGLMEIGEWVVPHVEITACRDPDDNMLLSLAVSGNADCVVTGDQDLLVLHHPFEGIAVIAPAVYLNMG